MAPSGIYLIGGLMKRLNKSSKELIFNKKGNNLTLQMDPLYKIVGYISVIFGIILGIAVIITEGLNKDGLIISLILFLLPCIRGIPLILMGRNIKVDINNKRIKYQSSIGRKKQISRTEIKAVRFSKFTLYLSIISEKDKIKLHLHLLGFGDFIRLMKQKLEPSLYRDAIRSINKIK